MTMPVTPPPPIGRPPMPPPPPPPDRWSSIWLVSIRAFSLSSISSSLAAGAGGWRLPDDLAG
jgi:hypothetical protein